MTEGKLIKCAKRTQNSLQREIAGNSSRIDVEMCLPSLTRGANSRLGDRYRGRVAGSGAGRRATVVIMWRLVRTENKQQTQLGLSLGRGGYTL